MLSPLLLGFAHRVVENVPYLQDGRYEHQLDLYIPERAGAPSPPLPVVVFTHGGGWKRGDRRSGVGLHQNVGRALAEAGVMAVLPSYRKSYGPSLAGTLTVAAAFAPALCYAGRRSWRGAAVVAAAAAVVVGRLWGVGMESVRWPSHAEDVAAAVGWVHSHIAEHGGDPTRLLLAGHSAGGHISAMLLAEPAFLRGAGVPVEHVRGLFGLSAPLDHTLLLGTAVGYPLFRYVFGDDALGWAGSFPSGLCGDPARVAALRLPPVLLVTSEPWDLGLEEHAHAWARQLERAGVPVRIEHIEGSGHFSEIFFFQSQPLRNLLRFYAELFPDDAVRRISAPPAAACPSAHRAAPSSPRTEDPAAGWRPRRARQS